MLESGDIAISALAFLAGSIVVSATGFGLAMVASPLLLLALEPATAVVTMNTVVLGVFAVVIFRNRAHLPIREMAPVTAAGLLGVPGGLYVLVHADAGLLRIAISLLVLLLAALAAFTTRGPLAYPRMSGLPLGFVVGSLLTATGIGGPLLALYLLGRGWESHRLRASLALFFISVGVTGVVGYAAAGMYTAERLKLVLIVAAPALVGVGLGFILVRWMSEAVFRRAALLVIVAGSLMVLARELAAMQGGA